MAIDPSTLFAGKIAIDLTNYPDGKARDISAPGDGTGTPFVADLVNDWFGFFQRLLDEAGVAPSGNPDTVPISQYFDSLRKTDTWINVEAFGAVHDGATDDSVAIQAAIDFVAPNGGGVYFPPGVYICEAITVASDVHLLGMGGVLKLQNAADTFILKTDNGTQRTTIQNLRFDGNSANNAGTPGSVGLVQIGSTSGSPSSIISVLGNTIEDADQQGILVDDGADDILIDGNRIDGSAAGAGIVLSQASGIVLNMQCVNNVVVDTFLGSIVAVGTLKGCVVSRNRVSGLSTTAAAGAIALNNDNNTRITISENDITDAASEGILAGGNPVIIENNSITNWVDDGILLQTATPGVISKCTISGNVLQGKIAGGSDRGIVAFDCDGCAISGNRISFTDGDGILYENTGGAGHRPGLSISGNVVLEHAGGAGIAGGIHVDGGAGLIGAAVNSNDVRGVSVVLSNYGVQLTDCTDVMMTGNQAADSANGIIEAASADFNLYVGNGLRLCTVAVLSGAVNSIGANNMT